MENRRHPERQHGRLRVRGLHLWHVFLKCLSDAFEEAQEGVIAHYVAEGRSQSEAEQLAFDEDEYDNTFFVPERGRWSNIKNLKHDIGSELNKATEAIEEHNPSLEGVLVTIDLNIKFDLLNLQTLRPNLHDH